MTAVVETAIALEWLYAVLTGDAGLTSTVTGVYRSMAPDKATAPWVIIGYMAGTDTTTMNAVRIFSPLLYQVKVVGPASMMQTLVSAASEVDSLLKRTSGFTDDGQVLAAYREQALLVDELVNGVLYTNIGGLYRTYIKQYN